MIDLFNKPARLIKTIWNESYILDFIINTKGYGARILALGALIAIIPPSIISFINLSSMNYIEIEGKNIPSSAAAIIQAMPEITLNSEGKFSAPNDAVLTDENGKNRAVIAINDGTKIAEDADVCVIFTANDLIMRGVPPCLNISKNTMAYPFSGKSLFNALVSQGGELKIDQKTSVLLVDNFLDVIKFFMPVALWANLFLQYMVRVLFVGLAGLAVAYAFKMIVPFKLVIRISAIAALPAMIISALNPFIGFPLQHAEVVTEIFHMTYLIWGLITLRTSGEVKIVA
jgi:hypothetical protein